MITLELTYDEVEQLRFILDSYLTDLRGEIHETDNRDFRADLKKREQFIKSVLDKLGAEIPASAR
jgi:hypothetical protein